MLGYLPAIILQTIGVIIPLFGIVILIHKGQGKSNAYLIMANLGALIMNFGYLNVLISSNYQEVISVYKFEYIGNVIFYLDFVLFIKTFFIKNNKSKVFMVAYAIFFVIEISTLGSILTDSGLAYENIDVNYREDDGKLYTKMHHEEGDEKAEPAEAKPESTDDDKDKPEPAKDEEPVKPKKIEKDQSYDDDLESSKGYMFMKIYNGTMLTIRYSYLALILLVAIITSLRFVLSGRMREERGKIIYMICAESVVFASLIISLTTDTSFDVVPIFASASILSIICGTANGELFTITDRGRGWVLEHSENIFIIIDFQYHFLDANPYAREVFPELKGLAPHTLLPEELKCSLMCEESELERDGKKYAKKLAPIMIRKKTVGYSILLVDMTAHYNMLSQVEEERQKAIDANEAKSNFMSNMSHEIRTPMNAIVGMTELMLRRDQDSVNREYLNNIKNSGNALLTVINDILDFSKIESGKMELVPDEYEMMSVLNDLGMIFLNRIGDKPIELIYDIDPALPHRLMGDAGRIRQVLTNIVNNGIKYTDEGYVKLTMRCEEAHDSADGKVIIACAVEDSGIGIKEEDIAKLFSNFSQVDTKRNRGKEGTGLGLSIAKMLVEEMGGRITVESVYGKGSVFSFNMVQEIVDDQPAAIVKGKDPIFVSGKLNDLNLEMLKKLCGYYDSVTYVDLKEAIEADKKVDFFFVECDSLNPENCPVEVADYLKKMQPETILIHNPMLEGVDLEGATVMNKPLYTLNFCLALNHEVLSFEEQQEQMMCFTAPEARVLIVDDNEMNRKVALGLMEPIGLIMDTAVDGKDAIEKVTANRYDIVFMDHMMPIMDGVEATVAIRGMEDEYYKNLPIIGLSANALAEARAQFKEVGMDDFLAKPIKTKELFKIILKYLPENKVQKCDTIVKDAVSEDIELPVIEGLDVAAGVENSGGLTLFTSLLGDFYKLIDRKAVKIEKCLADGMIRDYTIEVHALKNTARMIGALELSDMFYKLEMAGNAEDMETILKETPETLKLYRSYKPILEPYAVSGNEEKREADTEEITSLLDRLKNAVDSFDLDDADGAMKELENVKMPEEIREMTEDLSAYVADVAMEEIMELCDRIRVRLEEISK